MRKRLKLWDSLKNLIYGANSDDSVLDSFLSSGPRNELLSELMETLLVATKFNGSNIKIQPPF